LLKDKAYISERITIRFGPEVSSDVFDHHNHKPFHFRCSYSGHFRYSH